jgi:Tol biopolymer transport system component/DNA-binding winged helix-turn-helix (wHTH) protein
MNALKERSVYEFGEFRLDPEARRLSALDGRPIVLHDRSFDALLCLVERAGGLVAKKDLMMALWPGMVVEENNLNQTISRLRRALGDDPQSPRFIATVTRRGYQFIGEVRTVVLRREPGRPCAADDSTAERAEPQAALEAATASPGRPSGGSARGPRFGIARPAVYFGATLALAIVMVAVYRLAGDEDAAAVASADPALSVTASELITNFAGAHSQPTLSPSGRMMAFASNASGTSQVWIQSLTGSDPIQITHGDRPARWPSWSPRDDSILFERTAPDGQRSIWSVGAFGPRAPRIIVERGAMPSFSWDGESFVYAVGAEVWIADADGGHRRRIDGVPGGPGLAPPAPSLSPDGALVAFVRADLGPYGDLWLIAAAGGEARRLTFHGLGIDSAYSGAPAWTPDGRFLIYAAAVGAVANQHLMRVHVESGEVEQLTSGVGDYGRPVVARDGRRLVYTSTRSVWRLMRTDPDTLAHEPLYESRNPIVHTFGSPDGRSVAFFSLLPSGAHVFTIGADGEGLRQWTFDEIGRNFSPVWGGGRRLYYYKDTSLAMLSLEDGRSTELLDEFSVTTRPYLIAHGDMIAYMESGPAGFERTVIRNVATGVETALPQPPVIPTQFSKDGRRLLGFRTADGQQAIVVCSTTGETCAVLAGRDGPVRGREPRWSVDESRIYFRRLARPPKNSPYVDEFGVIDSNGENERTPVKFGPVDDHTAFAVARDGALIWSHYRRDDDEIWATRVDHAPASDR